jgi:hypothetical protein
MGNVTSKSFLKVFQKKFALTNHRNRISIIQSIKEVTQPLKLPIQSNKHEQVLRHLRTWSTIPPRLHEIS